MSKNKIIAGIEIGSSKITTLISQVFIEPSTNESTINVLGVASVASRGIKKGQVVDIEETVEATITSVEAAERMAGYNLESAFVAIGGAHIHSQNSHGVVAVAEPNGEISNEDVTRVIEAASAISLPQSREMIHVLPREYIVDGESGVKDPIGMSGVRLELDAHLISAASPALKNIRKTVDEVGVRIDGIIFSALAAGEAVLTETEKELGCVLIDVGGGTTSVAVYVDGALTYSGVIPVGAKNVTNDLAIGLRVSLDAAETIKQALSLEAQKKAKNKDDNGDELDLNSLGITETKTVSKKTLIEGIIRPRLNEIFTMVKMELDRAGVGSRIPSGAIITGGGAETVGILESARRSLALPVRIGVPKGVSGLIDDIMSPAFSVCVGLLLYGNKTYPKENLNSLTKKFKLPAVGVFGKLIETIKNLLP